MHQLACLLSAFRMAKPVLDIKFGISVSQSFKGCFDFVSNQLDRIILCCNQLVLDAFENRTQRSQRPGRYPANIVILVREQVRDMEYHFRGTRAPTPAEALRGTKRALSDFSVTV